MENLKMRLKSFVILFAMIMLAAPSIMAQIIAKGVIQDVGKEPMVGVAVKEKGTNNGVLTDIDGQFSLKVSPSAILEFSYVGYKPLEMPAKADMGVITMQEDTEQLDEVVVVGYGTQKKVNLSGAVSAIDGDKISSKPTTDVLTALQGEVPGLQVLRTSGEPGSETSGMRVRGFSSANATSTLVLIDGVEGDMTLLNPNDIASISVLKDAAASAI